MQEQLISFETAKLAKEKGFNIPVIYVFDDIDGTLTASYVKNVFDLLNYNTSIHKCSRPTQSLLQKWLREKYKIQILIQHYTHIKDGELYAGFVYNPNIIYCDTPCPVIRKALTYEEALEICLQKSLKLI